MTFKKDYFSNKLEYWKKEDRNLLAKRDFDTITYLLKTFYGFELKENSNVLDLVASYALTESPVAVASTAGTTDRTGWLGN
mgnify:CR=1 FL=1